MAINVRSEVLSKLSVTIVTVIVDSPWLWLLWASQFLVLGGVWLARRALENDRSDLAMIILVLGHGAGGLGAVIGLPAIAPLVMLVLFGDLALTGFCTRRGVRPYVAICLALVAATALLSLTTWSDLVDSVPIGLVIVAFVLQGLPSGAVTSLTSREVYIQLRDRGERLRSLTARLGSADREERLWVANRLSSVTMGDLDDLANQVDEMRTALRLDERPDELLGGQLVRATDLSKSSLARLRSLSHGLHPDVLFQHGLVAAIGSMVGLREPGAAGRPGTRVVLVEHPATRLPIAIESAFYSVIVALTQATPEAELHVGVRTRRGYAELLVVADTLVPDPDVVARLSDQVSAVFGDLQVIGAGPIAGSPSDLVDGIDPIPAAAPVVIHAAAPLVQPQGLVTTAPDGTWNPQPILRRFIVGSIVLCAAGLVAAVIVWAGTRLASVGVVVGVLCVVMVSVLAAGIAERRRRPTIALALLSFEASFAGLVLTAVVPEFAPTAALIVVLPISLGLPYLTTRQLNIVGAIASLMVTAVAVMGLMSEGVIDDGGLPAWVPLLLLAPTSVAVAVLGVVGLADGRSTISATNERLQNALVALMGAREATRRQVERDLHDGAQQHLAALAIQFGVVGRLTSTPDRADRALETVAVQIDDARTELQTLVDGSFGDVVRSIGLESALQRVAAGSLNVVTNDVEVLPEPIALVVYFVCNEAIQNATKHAGDDATVDVLISVTESVTESGRRNGGVVAFSISDDGVGCDPARLAAGHGIRSLRQRLADVGGTLHAISEPGCGTTLSGEIRI
jgi:signal transduction histidine kinase